MGHIADFVPNHVELVTKMPVDGCIAQWRNSQYAAYFDIDWNAGKLMIPYW